MKNQRKMLILIIAITLVTLIGSSYALLRSTSTGTNPYIMNVGNLQVDFGGNIDTISLTNAYPMTDEEGMEQTDILEFTVTNNGNLKANYNVYIEETSTSPEFKTVIRYIVNKDDSGYDEPRTLSDNKYIEQNGVLETGNSANYKVKVWLAETADYTYMNKEFKARIVVEASQHSTNYYEGQEVLEIVKQNAPNHEGVYYFDENGDLDYGDGTKITLNLERTIPKGNVSIWNNQVIYACFNYGEYNYEYSYNETLTTRSMPCITDRYQNLVINGDLSYGNNNNLEQFGFYNQDGDLSKTTSTSSWNYSTDYIPIDPNKKYEVGIDMKASNTDATYFVGFAEFDVNKINISPKFVMYINDTLTELTKDLKPGDTIVYLQDLSNWNTTTSFEYQKGFIVWNYKDLTGYMYPELTFSKTFYNNLYRDNNAVNKTNNTITLDSAWPETQGTISKGTKISQSNDGSMHNYSVLQKKSITQEFTSYKSQLITGINSTNNVSNTQFRAGAKFVRFMIVMNFNDTPDTTTYMKNFYIREVQE